MHLRGRQIERDDRQDREPPLGERARVHEAYAAESVRAVEQLGRGNRGDAHGFVRADRQRGIEVQSAAFSRDQDARVDQGSHRFSGTSGRLYKAMPSSTAVR